MESINFANFTFIDWVIIISFILIVMFLAYIQHKIITDVMNLVNSEKEKKRKKTPYYKNMQIERIRCQKLDDNYMEI
jgi:hypothetical protein